MKPEKDSNIIDNLLQQLGQILEKAKANDLCHLIEPIEETILKVKELNRTTKVECDHKGECNSDTSDLQMACSCNDFGPDILGPNGKWICQECGENCSCSETWDSLVDIPEEKSKKKNSHWEDKFEGKNKKPFENDGKNFTDEQCSCLLKKIDIKRTENKSKDFNAKCKSNSRDCPVSVLYEQRSSRRKYSVESDEERLDSPGIEKSKRQEKLPSKRVQLISEDSSNLSKCQDCKCTTDENNKTIKTEECKMASGNRRQNLEPKVSQSKNEKEAPSVFGFANEEKSCEIKAKCGREFLSSPTDLKELSCGNGMKELLPETGKEEVNCEKPEKPLKCSEIQNHDNLQKEKIGNRKIGKPPCQKCPAIKNAVSDENRFSSKMKSSISLDLEDEKVSEGNENIQKRLDKCSTRRKNQTTANKNCFAKKAPINADDEDKIVVESVRKIEKRKTACNKCSSSVKSPTSPEIGCGCSSAWTEKMKQDFKNSRENANYSETVEPTRRDDGFQKSDKEINRRQKVQAEKTSDFYNSVASKEELCTCGCGFFKEGVTETRTVSCSRSPTKNLCRKISTSKNNPVRSQHCDCEGSCDWCDNI